jgi:hypothetical protein
MTEDQIERKVETLFNRLDACLMAGKVTQEQYDRDAKVISEWAARQYRCAPQIIHYA